MPRVYLHAADKTETSGVDVYAHVHTNLVFLNSHIFKLSSLSSTRNCSESADSSADYSCEKNMENIRIRAWNGA